MRRAAARAAASVTPPHRAALRVAQGSLRTRSSTCPRARAQAAKVNFIFYHAVAANAAAAHAAVTVADDAAAANAANAALLKPRLHRDSRRPRRYRPSPDGVVGADSVVAWDGRGVECIGTVHACLS